VSKTGYAYRVRRTLPIPVAVAPLESVVRSFAAAPTSLAPARHAVAALARAAGATPEEVEDIRLATSEAVTNAIVHAYPDETGDIHLTAAVAGGELWLLVADDGSGLHRGRGTSGLGLGLTLIAQASDELTIVKRSNGGTELRMRFRLGARSPVSGQARGSIRSASSPAASSFSTTR
jgi:anti-sigma regulatory factor (Ser/Thr protein kinase)